MTNKAILAKKLYKSYLAKSHITAVLFIDAFLEAVVESLAKGEQIELRGFGTFLVKKQAARKTSINNNMTIAEHSRIIFRPCESLRRAVWNYGNAKAKE